MTSLWFVTAAWQRFELARLCFDQRHRLCDELAAMGIDANCVVVGDDDNLDIAREYGFATIEQRNVMGLKFNDGIEYACREGGADYVVPIGADDWCLPDLFAGLPDERTIKTGSYAAFVDPAGERICIVHAEGGIGHIPWIIPRALLEPCGYRPGEDTVTRGIDGSIRRGLLARLPGVERPNARRRKRGLQPDVDPFWPVACDPLQLVDFKSPSGQVTPYERERVRGRGGNIREEANPFRLLATRYPPDLCERMEALYLSRRMVAA